MSEDAARPAIPYWHVWTDDHGTSRTSRAALTHFDLKSMSGGSAKQWQDTFDAQGATIIFTVLPVGWEGPWHENPQPQWIIPLSGAWMVETMDGQAVTMGPGDISFGEDQRTIADASGHKGHFSRTVGDQPCVQMVVQLNIPSTTNQPGRFA